MPSASLSRAVLAATVTTAVLALGACNSLLDNRPADVRDDPTGSEPDDAGTSAREAARDVDASVPGPSARPDAAPGPRAPECPVDTRRCGELCVRVDDPRYGCGGPTCERCAPAHGAGTCVAGRCAVGECAPGWADCNALANDGCEADLSTAASCGACDVVCAAPPHADATCADGECVTTCQEGFDDCNGDPIDGCETTVLTDKHHCGQCGRLCILGDCEAGKCVWKL